VGEVRIQYGSDKENQQTSAFQAVVAGGLCHGHAPPGCDESVKGPSGGKPWG
jgi:hypothetical protein